jgi:hypothetical protein
MQQKISKKIDGAVLTTNPKPELFIYLFWISDCTKRIQNYRKHKGIAQ